jgi:hypothetical protein
VTTAFKCDHANFHANVEINRLLDKDEKAVVGYSACVKIRCTECLLPFEFIGMSAGLSGAKPMVDVSAQEARLPIKPKGVLLMPGIPGFEVKVL